MKKVNWKEMTIADSHYSGALYLNHRLVIKSGFYVSKRLYKKLNERLKFITVIYTNLNS